MQRVEIRVKEHLDKNWAEWLGDFTITHVEPHETILLGSVPDQAALYGLVSRPTGVHAFAFGTILADAVR